MAVFAQHFVLGEPEPVDCPHEHAPFAGQVAEDFLLEGRFKEIARADGNAARQAAVESPAAGVLMYGIAAVDALTFQEQPPHSRA